MRSYTVMRGEKIDYSLDD